MPSAFDAFRRPDFRGRWPNMKPTHTPGPWKVEGPHRRNGAPDLYTIRNADGFSITSDSEPFLEKENANLIAAAPDLLTMLERLVAEISMTEEGLKLVALLTMEQSRQAITKAEGK